MFLLFSRFLALILIACFLLGCSTDDNGISTEISTITIEVIESVPEFQQEEGRIWFRLSVVPAPIEDLAVLIESEIWNAVPEDQESGYTWIIIPKFVDSKEFSLGLGEHVPWEVKILPLSGVNLNAYPIDGFEIPAGFKFRDYAVGNPSTTVTVPVLAASLQDVWPDSSDSIPANGSLILFFDPLPKNIAVSHGQLIIDGDLIKVIGPFPLGTLRLEVDWDDGRGNSTVRRTISEPDFESPKLIEAVAFTADGFGVWFDKNGWVFPDAEKIELVFSEIIWVNENMIGNIDIQTVAGDNLGWKVEFRLFSSNKIVLVRSGGKPLNPGTYVVFGTVTDLANETEVEIPFITR